MLWTGRTQSETDWVRGGVSGIHHTYLVTLSSALQQTTPRRLPCPMRFGSSAIRAGKHITSRMIAELGYPAALRLDTRGSHGSDTGSGSDDGTDDCDGDAAIWSAIFVGDGTT